jgi:hypothetical protein
LGSGLKEALVAQASRLSKRNVYRAGNAYHLRIANLHFGNKRCNNMIFEISFGAILGYVGKEMVELLKSGFKERQEKRRVYFNKKLELTISSMRILNAIMIQLHNCALSLKWIKSHHEIGNIEGLKDATRIFIGEYKEMHKKAKEFPHEVTLFYDLPSFDELFGQFNDILENVLQFPANFPFISEDSSQFIVSAQVDEINSYFTKLTEFDAKMEEKKRLMEKCLKEIREQFRKNEASLIDECMGKWRKKQ